jgi:hypothetical protein
MPAATGPVFRYVVFAQHQHAKGKVTWPVRVFANEDKAASFRRDIADAQRTGDHTKMTSLDPDWRMDADGKPLTGVKWATRKLPYGYTPVESSSNPEDEFEL